jgi:hypothetical protein
MENFVEKAAQAVGRKFRERPLQGVFAGRLNHGSPDNYFRSLASNLRGRLLQLFPPLPAGKPEDQNPELPSLFCLAGREGMFCGVQSPRESNGFFPGGTRFVRQDSDSTISRAGAKIAGALHYLRLWRQPPPPGSQWLELGASPGGMTAELLMRDYRVTAVDRAPLDPRLDHRPGLRFVASDAGSFRPPPGVRYDALLCDLNGEARNSFQYVVRLAPHLVPRGLVVFTLKTAGADSLAAMLGLVADVIASARDGGLELIAKTHLAGNRREFTLFFELAASAVAGGAKRFRKASAPRDERSSGIAGADPAQEAADRAVAARFGSRGIKRVPGPGDGTVRRLHAP